MNVLITGANGYIGARLTVHLLKNKVNVRVATRVALSHRPEFEGAQPVTLDFENPCPESLENACRDIDAIIHLAALNDQRCRENPEKALNVNGHSTHLLAQAAQKTNVNQFIYFSSVHVYGAPLRGHYTEDSLAFPASHFALTHKFAEDYVRISDVPVKTVFRLSNGVGAPVFPETNCWMLLVNDLCRQAVMTGKMVLKSNGLQLRNFISLSQVEDVVFQSLADSRRAKSSFDLINLVGVSRNVLEMAKEIQATASHVLSRDIQLIVPEATPREIQKSSDAKLIFETRVKGYSPEKARLECGRAIEETLRFCLKHFGRSCAVWALSALVFLTVMATESGIDPFLWALHLQKNERYPRRRVCRAKIHRNFGSRWLN